MVKRRLSSLLILMMVLSAVVVSATTDYLSVEVTQPYVELPEIKLYTDIYDTEDNKVAGAMNPEDFTVLIDGKNVEITSVTPFKDAGEGIGYTFLVDISKSLTDEEFDAIKAMMKEWVGGMNAKDQVAVVSFGEAVEVVQNFSGNMADTLAVIDGLELTDNSTRFYDGINKALDIAKVVDENLPDRRVIYAITDGQDDYVGGVQKDEVIGIINETPIPVYALGVFTGQMTEAKEDGLNVLGEIVRASGGTYHQMGSEGYDVILSDVQLDIEACHIIELFDKELQADGSYHDVYVAFESEGTKIEDTIQVLMNNRMKDRVAPEVLSVTVDEMNVVTVQYSEDVIGADVAANYTTTYVPSEEDDSDDVIMEQVLVPLEVVYSVNEDETATAVLTYEGQQNGNYALTIAGIIDASPEANSMVVIDHELTFVVEVIAEPVPEPTFVESYGLYILIAGLLLIVLIIVIAMSASRKKKRVAAARAAAEAAAKQAAKPSNVNMANSNQPGGVTPSTVQLDGDKRSKPSIMLHFAIVDHNQEEKVMDKMITDTLIIGRSADCDLTFDDNEMSRKHCKLIFENGALSVEDLNATNTTIVNGIPIHDRKKLDSDDMLLIGQTEFRVTFFLG